MLAPQYNTAYSGADVVKLVSLFAVLSLQEYHVALQRIPEIKVCLMDNFKEKVCKGSMRSRAKGEIGLLENGVLLPSIHLGISIFVLIFLVDPTILLFLFFIFFFFLSVLLDRIYILLFCFHCILCLIVSVRHSPVQTYLFGIFLPLRD